MAMDFIFRCFGISRRDKRVVSQKDFYRQYSARSIVDSKRITVLKEICSGSFGKIYKGTVKPNDIAVALKIAHCEDAQAKRKDSLIHENLLQIEAESMMDVDHQNIVKTYGVSFIQNNFTIVLEWMEGGSLKNVLLNNELTQKRQIEVLRDAAQGMHHLTRQNIVHRDLAARNCLLDEKGVVKIADFGLSRVNSTRAGGFSRKKSFIRQIPIPMRWMPKESVEMHFFDELTDVWSFGVLIYEVLSKGLFSSEPAQLVKISRILKLSR
ncbi:unnamed protein product [Oikopleura dioica]|uniref:Protein kinase domain-containing protein n=1 Tax=Oikopleura dioica TaxID=34765 RepID=E4WTS1_OIKDI|nr:unnamed protein product [Oikopleura dioica]